MTSVKISDKFIYLSTVYKIWNGGASLVDEQYYSSNKPIVLKKKNRVAKYKDYYLYRFFELRYAPEQYLIENNLI